jgi:hypothetical protein
MPSDDPVAEPAPPLSGDSAGTAVPADSTIPVTQAGSADLTVPADPAVPAAAGSGPTAASGFPAAWPAAAADPAVPAGLASGSAAASGFPAAWPAAAADPAVPAALGSGSAAASGFPAAWPATPPAPAGPAAPAWPEVPAGPACPAESTISVQRLAPYGFTDPQGPAAVPVHEQSGQRSQDDQRSQHDQRSRGGPGSLRVRLSRRAWIATVAGIAVAALVAGAIAWSPWTPGPPAAVRAGSVTATTARLTWERPGGITAPDSYLVLRDGVQVADVPADATSWTDHGLAPGTTYDYTVKSKALLQSGPSAAATVTTLAPSPENLAVTHLTYTTATMHWTPPAAAPTPDSYQVYNGPDLVDTIEGTVTSYTDTTQTAGSPFQYSVVAQWGDHKSRPSARASGSMAPPPLTGSVPASVRVTSVPAGWIDTTLKTGQRWSDTWDTSTDCHVDSCDLTVGFGIYWSKGYAPAAYFIKLTGSSGGYSGVGHFKETACQGVLMSDTFTLTMTPARGRAASGAWRAWTATLRVDAPSGYEKGQYCSPGTWKFTATGTS